MLLIMVVALKGFAIRCEAWLCLTVTDLNILAASLFSSLRTERRSPYAFSKRLR
jgi:hypothetical protein